MPTIKVIDLYWQDGDESLANLPQYFPEVPFEEFDVQTELLLSLPRPVIAISGDEKVISDVESYLALGDFLVERMN
jgi:hypothetical protein